VTVDEINPARRTYRKQQRAADEARTRLRITEATMRLHGTVGPARTTIAAIADGAGVQRATVYRHFPDAEALFLACSTHWASLNPPPDPAGWRRIADPDRRLRHALEELYDWFAWAEPMLANVLRDIPLVPAAACAAEPFDRHFGALHAALMRGRRTRRRRRARIAAAIGHALDFATWRSLTLEHGLERDEAVALMIALVAAAGRLRTRRSRATAR
jgi:AcrR family transcriptional regulator